MNKKGLVVHLKLYKPISQGGRLIKTISRDEDDKIINETQRVSLLNGTLEYYNYLKNMTRAGWFKGEVQAVFDKVSGSYKSIEIPDSIKQDVVNAFAEPRKELTPQEQQIKDLQDQINAMQSGKTEDKSSQGSVNTEDGALKDARAQYKDILKKKPYAGWDVDTIQAKIEEFQES